MIREHVQALPNLARSLIAGYYFEEKGCAELADEYGVSRPNVKYRLFRARRRLKWMMR